MKIENYTPIADNGALIARFTVILNNGWPINGCKLFEKGNQKWIGMPQTAIKDANGELVYSEVTGPPKEQKKDFGDACLKAIKELPNLGEQ